MPNIFISYRRADDSAVAGRIHEHLANAFGQKNVFKDVDDIPPGADFREVLEQAISICDVMLVIIGKGWVLDRRIEDPDDFVRIELETALRTQSARVIPLLVSNASMPTKEVLPPSLHKLAYLNAVAIREDPDFVHDMDRLITDLKQINPQPRLRVWQIVAAIGLVLALAIIAFLLITGGDSSEPVAQASSTPTTPPTDAPAATHTLPATASGAGERHILVEEDFEDGSPGEFQPVSGTWEIVTEDDGNIAYRGMGLNDGEYPAAYIGSRDWTDYGVELRVKPIEPGNGTFIIVRSVDGNNDYALDFLKGGDEVYIAKLTDAVYETLSSGNIPLHYDDWNTVRLEVNGNRISAVVNGEALPDAVDDTFSAGRVSLQISPGTTALFDDITIWSSEEQ